MTAGWGAQGHPPHPQSCPKVGGVKQGPRGGGWGSAWRGGGPRCREESNLPGRWDVNVHFNKARRTRQASCSGEEAVNGRGWDMLRGPEGKRTAAGPRAASNSVTSGESPPLEPPLSPSEERGDEVRHRLRSPEHAGLRICHQVPPVRPVGPALLSIWVRGDFTHPAPKARHTPGK